MPVIDGSHPCLVDGNGREGFDLWGFSPLGAVPEAALFSMADFPTSRYWAYKGRWKKDEPMAEFVCHAPVHAGGKAVVEVFTTGDGGVLYVNGRSQGYRRTDPEMSRISWQADYEPGEMEAVIYKGGRPWIRKKAVPVGEPAAVVWAEGIEARIAGMDPEKPCVLRIPVEVVDAAGQPVADAEPVLEFSLAGHGRILAVDAGDPASDTPFTAQKIKAFRGKAAIYIYKKGDERILLTVRAQGLKCPRLEL